MSRNQHGYSSNKLGPKARRFQTLAYVGSVAIGGSLLLAPSTSFADSHPTAPSLSSRSGAAYTIYLDFSGFNYSGNWATSGDTPGTLAAFDNVASTGTFSSTDNTNIDNIWARVAQEYIGYNVNVTTIDPAVAAGQAGTDTARQSYYDNQAQMMQTIITPSYTWFGAAGGVSYVGVTPNAQPGSNGLHTNFVFPSELSNNNQYIGQGISHENGHGMGLYHQSDYSGNTLINEYSQGTGTGAGSVAPVMGESYFAQRGLWSVGTADASNGGNPSAQNDAKIIANDSNMGGFINDGVGHNFTAATALAMIGNTVNFNLDKGVIVPNSNANPNPIGQINYQPDFWRFTTSGGTISLTANSGTEFFSPGTADPGATLDALLYLYNSSNTLITSTPIVAGSLSNTLSTTVGAGTYYAELLNAANATDTSYTTRNFYDMGAYFLSGSIPVPEPATLGMLAIGAVGLLVGQRKSKKTL